MMISSTLKSNFFLQSLAFLLLCCSCTLHAQDNTDENADGMAGETSPSGIQDSASQPVSKSLQADAFKARQLVEKKDNELRARLRNTIWNDIDLLPGDPGQVWYLRVVPTTAGNSRREWYYSNSTGLSLAGSWDVKEEQIYLLATDGTLMGQATLDENSVIGRFIDPIRKKPFGSFHLQEETSRRYRVLRFRVIDPKAGK